MVQEYPLLAVAVFKVAMVDVRIIVADDGRVSAGRGVVVADAQQRLRHDITSIELQEFRQMWMGRDYTRWQTIIRLQGDGIDWNSRRQDALWAFFFWTALLRSRCPLVEAPGVPYSLVLTESRSTDTTYEFKLWPESMAASVN